MRARARLREWFAPLALAAVLALPASPVLAESAYTDIDFDACTILATFEGGGFDARCDGLDGIDVFVGEGDARQDVDYGVENDVFESFSAFNSAGDTIEWVSDAQDPAAAILRFFLSVDGDENQALVVSRIGTAAAPGCVIGVVDAGEDQANGIARGMAALARTFDCATDIAPVLAPADSLVSTFYPANG